MMSHNASFVTSKAYEKYALPDDAKIGHKAVVVTCMDSRLVDLLPKAMGIKPGAAKIIKTAGAVLTHPFGGESITYVCGSYSSIGCRGTNVKRAHPPNRRGRALHLRGRLIHLSSEPSSQYK